MNYKTIRYEKDDAQPHILYITLDRPTKRNAISIGADKMTGELQDAIRSADSDDGVKVVVFRGAGEDFSAGFDLSMVYRVYGGDPNTRPHQSTRLRLDEEQLFGFPRAIFNCKKVTMAQVQGGWCIEAGLWIPENCDIAIAATNAKFAHRGQRLAFGGMISPLEIVSGHMKKQVEFNITGRTISGQEAEEIGIVTKAVPPEQLEDEVYNLAKAIALLPLDAICMGKAYRKHVYESLGINSWMNGIVYHTLATNITYRDSEKDIVFIRDREKYGERESFHRLHDALDEALERTRYFKCYSGQ